MILGDEWSLNNESVCEFEQLIVEVALTIMLARNGRYGSHIDIAKLNKYEFRTYMCHSI